MKIGNTKDAAKRPIELTKRIILQHWDSEDMPEIVRRSSENIHHYAERLGVEYCMLHGFPWDDRLKPQFQKLAMLEYDEYDTVVMLDADMFAVKDCTESIFDEKGVGWHHGWASKRLRKRVPSGLTRMDAPFWGGAVYRLDRVVRTRLRACYRYEDALCFNKLSSTFDEGMMHRMAALAGMRVAVHTPEAAPTTYISMKWCWPSFENPSKAAILHMRPTMRGRPSYPADGLDKMGNYRRLRDAGVLS